MRIGLDFDNTLAGYDRVFPAAARAAGLIPEDFAGAKAEIRAVLRARLDGERAWMALQGRVYGAHMHLAEMMDGAKAFLCRAKAGGHKVFVVSHKTVYGHFDPDRVNLREAALAWMEANGFFGSFGIGRNGVFFADDRPAKVAQIAALGLDVFVDDLEEVFREPGWPVTVRPMLFTNGRPGPSDLPSFTHWDAITRAVFGDS